VYRAGDDPARQHISGYRLALTVAGILLLVGAAIAFARLGRSADRTHP
jgi:hypothetical protein